MKKLSPNTVRRARTRAIDIVPVSAAVVFALGVTLEVASASSKAHDLITTGSEIVSSVRCAVGSLLTEDHACSPGPMAPRPPEVPSPTFG